MGRYTTLIQLKGYITFAVILAPEVIEGVTKQTVMSDIYSIGGILHEVADHGTVIQTLVKQQLSDVATRCRSPHYSCRPTAKY